MCPFCVLGGPLGGPGKEKRTLRFASAIASEDPGPSTAGAVKDWCAADMVVRGVRYTLAFDVYE